MVRLTCSLLVAALVVGCGSGDDTPSGNRALSSGDTLGGDILGSLADVLSVEEYAEWCGSMGDGFADDTVTWGEYAEQLDTLLDETRGIDPPKALRGYHDVQITLVASTKAFVDTLDPGGVFNPFELFGVVWLFESQITAAEEALPAAARATLSEAGCIDSSGEEEAADETSAATSTPTPAPTPTAALGDVVPVGRVDAVVLSIDRDAFTLEGVSLTRVEVEFTNTRGAVEAVSSGQVRGIDTEGLENEPYDPCTDYDYSSGEYACPGPLGYEELTPGASARGYVYFVESPVYPLEFIQLWKRTGEYTIQRVDPPVAVPKP